MRDEAMKEVETPQSSSHGIEGAAHCSSGAIACGCPTCSLYRWYPPLLIVSTLLAGLFCILYLKKPVHVVSPTERDENVLPQSLPVKEQLQPDEQLESGFDSLVASPEVGLNPLQGSLPGDEGSRIEGGDPSSVSFEPVAGGTGFKPLVVDGPRRGLFVPIEKEAHVELEPSEIAAIAEANVPGIERALNGGLSVEVPNAGKSKLVAVFSAKGETEEASIPSDWAEDSVRVEPLVELLSSGFESVATPGVQVPSTSIIGDFYPAGVAQSSMQPEESDVLFH